MSRVHIGTIALALGCLGGLLTVPAGSALAAGRSSAAAATTLTEIRAAHQPGFDRLVFQFSGSHLPTHIGAGYVSRVVADPSGKTVPVVGSAFLRVHFMAIGHDSHGNPTYGPTRRAYALPGVIQVVSAGDFESVLSFGVGLAKREPFTVFTLANPSRIVIDVRTPYATTVIRDYFLNSHRFATGTLPYVQAVTRPVITPSVAFGALQRLFAGPTWAEMNAGLRFVSSRATGFQIMSISGGVARVRLTGGCGSGGSTFTVADEITPTLKQFSSVHWVKIYDPSGHTERPNGHSDSIPVCLEP